MSRTLTIRRPQQLVAFSQDFMNLDAELPYGVTHVREAKAPSGLLLSMNLAKVVTIKVHVSEKDIKISKKPTASSLNSLVEL